MKTVLVTGGAGFIGTNLIKSLLKEVTKLFLLTITQQVQKTMN